MSRAASTPRLSPPRELPPSQETGRRPQPVGEGRAADETSAHAMCERDADAVMRPWSGGPPVPIVSARGCTVTDADGNDYLDMTAGYFVNQAGHCHPRIVEAATAQLHRVMQVSGKQTTPASLALAEKLVDVTPPSIDKALFATGGSEATEFALKMARQHRQSEDIAYLENGYHGLTLGALEVCASERYRKSAGATLAPRTFQLPTPYCYRCKYRDCCETQCVDEAEARLDAHPDTAALIAEPMQAVGGIVPPIAWWARVDRVRKRRRMLLILDEIQTGLGRTGTMFASEHYGLEPDILTLGKGLSGGVGALSVAMASPAVTATFFAGTAPTNAGNAVSAAAGLALLDTLVDERLLDNAARMGVYLRESATALNDPWIGDVRFKGLFGGVELVLDRESRQILPKPLIQAVQRVLQASGILLTISGMYGNVLRVQPPLTITAAQIDVFIDALRVALHTVRTDPTDR